MAGLSLSSGTLPLKKDITRMPIDGQDYRVDTRYRSSAALSGEDIGAFAESSIEIVRQLGARLQEGGGIHVDAGRVSVIQAGGVLADLANAEGDPALEIFRSMVVNPLAGRVDVEEIEITPVRDLDPLAAEWCSAEARYSEQVLVHEKLVQIQASEPVLYGLITDFQTYLAALAPAQNIGVFYDLCEGSIDKLKVMLWTITEHAWLLGGIASNPCQDGLAHAAIAFRTQEMRRFITQAPKTLPTVGAPPTFNQNKASALMASMRIPYRNQTERLGFLLGLPGACRVFDTNNLPTDTISVAFQYASPITFTADMTHIVTGHTFCLFNLRDPQLPSQADPVSFWPVQMNAEDVYFLLQNALDEVLANYVPTDDGTGRFKMPHAVLNRPIVVQFQSTEPAHMGAWFECSLRLVPANVTTNPTVYAITNFYPRRGPGVCRVASAHLAALATHMPAHLA